MQDDIEVRLRRAFDSDDVAQKNVALRKAADTIAALRAENERLREAFADHLARALREFGKIPDDQLPQNAITLWRQTVEGFERVADRLTAPPEK